MVSFLIELAGIPVEVICRYPKNEIFMRNYISRKKPLLTVAPADADLEKIQADFDEMDRAEGRPPYRRSEAFLENNAIHALLAEKLADYNVLLIHGSALCMDGKACIFIAPSGTGKSTHARLWREVYGRRVWMINDDKPMLRIEENGIFVYGTPWDGKHHLSSNASAPLMAVVSLRRSERNYIEPLTGADAFPVLMKQACRSKNPVAMMKILELEKRLLEGADFYAMGCNLSPEAAKVTWEGIKAGAKRQKGF